MSQTITAAALVLADGSVFEGELIGTVPPGGIATGEVVFNTSLTGYQEIITDPSYAGQIITFTYPHIGNYGTNAADNEAARPWCRGVVVRELARRHSNWRAESSLDAFLSRAGVPGIGGIDTRRLTRVLRDTGSLAGAFGPIEGPDAVGEADLAAAAASELGTAGVDLVGQVSTDRSYTVGDGPRRVVAYDFGIKATMLRHLGRLATIEVVPAGTAAEEVLARKPDGVFLSNGPGDPEMAPYAVEAVRGLLGEVPVFGICLGHQVLALAAGGVTEKLAFGHHGGNHPVRDETTGKVEITSQNHNFAVIADSLAGVAEVTHVNLNDGVCEGLRLLDGTAFGVQYHPEAGPGPHDASYLFDRFADLMDGDRQASSTSHHHTEGH
jgi:carbamoyl-phosphate synthase small subunit